MPTEVKILADSLAPCGKRLTTFLATYPRPIHSEIMTHRALSKSSASSRAIPTERLIQRIVDDPWIPDYIGKNQRGMQATEQLDEATRGEAVEAWLDARDKAVRAAQHLARLGVHKQVVNRLLEPWMFITVIISGTDWNNFFALRDHEAAEPHFQHLARLMRKARDESTPRVLAAGQWHMPFIDLDKDYPLVFKHLYPGQQFAAPSSEADAAAANIQKTLLKVAVGRCARVSYLNHAGERAPQDDIDLCDRLCVQKPLHAAPGEHVAQALVAPDRIGNFTGWLQFRKTLAGETVEG